MQKQLSCADLFQTLPVAEQIRRINDLTDEQAQALLCDWSWHGRPNQFAPAGTWTYWLVLAGRGFGKTRTGAELVRQWIKRYPLVNLIGATADDARDIMIEGESGILAICPKDERPEYKKSARKLLWPNGAKSLIFTADEPDRLRGKQHMKLWGDESRPGATPKRGTRRISDYASATARGQSSPRRRSRRSRSRSSRATLSR
jgi:phage terminase large subunit-like protein